MGGNLRRVALRTAAVLLASGLVIAASWMLTPPYDAGRLSEADRQASKNEVPAPGSEAALRRMIGEIQQGHPDYARMDKNLADAIRGDAQERKRLASFGPLQSVDYLGGGKAGLLPGTGFRFDRFRVAFRNGTLIWLVSLGESGKIARMGFQSPDPPTPQQMMDGYASFPASVRIQRAAVQLGVLLAAALFGRLALRLRL